MLGGAPGKLFVLQRDAAALAAGTRAPEPLVLRANVGDCVVLDLAGGRAPAARPRLPRLLRPWLAPRRAPPGGGGAPPGVPGRARGAHQAGRRRGGLSRP